MILNIQPIIQRIRETDFASASIAKARTIYGILSVLESWVEDGSDLILQLVQSQPSGFLHGEQSIDGYEQADTLWVSLPLKERLLRLQAFYQTDIHRLSRGDDHKARRLLATAERTFEQCRRDAFDTCDTHVEEFLLFVSKCVKAVFAWLNAKYSNNIPLAPEAEATALLTIYCGMNTSPYDHELSATIGDKPYRLFDSLPASKLRAHLTLKVG